MRTRKTIHWADDIKKLTNAAFLGNLPQVKIKKRSSVKEQTITICNPKVPDAFKEAVQLIRTRTEDRIIGKSDCPVLLVTSAVPGEGKTTAAVNLAEAFAKKKYRVVLLDGDLRNPSVMKCMGLIGRKERGIAAVLKGQMDWEEALTDCRDLTLKILPGAGSTQNPAGLLRSVRMKTMIESLKEEADLLIIDTPPCGVLSDAALFGGIADGAVLVVHQGTTKDREVRRALEFFEDSQIPVCGYVLNGVQEGTTGYGYSSYGSYGYGKYGYGYGKYGLMGKRRNAGTVTGQAREQGGKAWKGRRKNEIYQKYLKNLLDRLLALVGTAALSWLLLGVGIAVRLDSPGPVLFRQKRVGRNGQYFYIYKFRTMRIDTPHDMPTHLLNHPDLFITRVGRFLRKTSLDELPQLFNILKGDMALVGPRPALWNQEDLISEREQYGANSVRPGLTGWAQIPWAG